MGLDTSHDAWSGSYRSFNRWRRKIAEAAGLPPLELMEGFYRPLNANGGPANWPTLYNGADTGRSDGFDGRPYLAEIDDRLPIRWDCLAPSSLHILLKHSDCDGEIEPHLCRPVADALEALIPMLPDEDAGGHIGNWREKTYQFVRGLREAADAGEPLEFR